MIRENRSAAFMMKWLDHPFQNVAFLIMSKIPTQQPNSQSSMFKYPFENAERLLSLHYKIGYV